MVKITDYSPFWKTIKEKEISQYNLIQSGINTGLLDRLRKNQSITIKTLEKICTICDCTPNDVVRFTNDEK